MVIRLANPRPLGMNSVSGNNLKPNVVNTVDENKLNTFKPRLDRIIFDPKPSCDYKIIRPSF